MLLTKVISVSDNNITTLAGEFLPVQQSDAEVNLKSCFTNVHINLLQEGIVSVCVSINKNCWSGSGGRGCSGKQSEGWSSRWLGDDLSVGKGAVQGVMVKFIRFDGGESMDKHGNELPLGARISKGPVGPLIDSSNIILLSNLT